MQLYDLALSALSSPLGKVVSEEETHAVEGGLLRTDYHIPTLAPEELFSLGPIHVTNSMLTTVLVVLFISALAFWLSRGMSLVPGRRQNFLEAIIEALLGLVEGAAGTRVGRIILPLIGTLFIYIIAANWFALLPGIGTITWAAVHNGETENFPLLRAPNSDYNMTLAMALLVIVIVQVAGFAAHGIGGHLKEFRNPLNIVDELFARPLSLSVRLFANVFAGEVLITVMLALSYVVVSRILVPVSLVIPAVFVALEIFFGLIQALVFALLSLIYITLAVGGHNTGHEDQHIGTTGEEHTPVGQAAAART